MLLDGATGELHRQDVEFDVWRVPGALEIPPAIARLHASMHTTYDGYIALGCVIRGETSHYDTVCNESARGIMNLGVYERIAIGNGILTVESRGQALARADTQQSNKGAGAVQACMVLLALGH